MHCYFLHCYFFFTLFFSVCLLSSSSVVIWAMLPDANKWMDGWMDGLLLLPPLLLLLLQWYQQSQCWYRLLSTTANHLQIAWLHKLGACKCPSSVRVDYRPYLTFHAIKKNNKTSAKPSQYTIHCLIIEPAAVALKPGAQFTKNRKIPKFSLSNSKVYLNFILSWEGKIS